VDGISEDATWDFGAPLAGLLRSWVERHRGEDIAGSLALLEDAIGDDRRRTAG
jgi:hypothetical protein